jgi:hypothetical protein
MNKIKQFELVAQKAGQGHPSSAMARERVRELQARVRGISAEPGAAPDQPGPR